MVFMIKIYLPAVFFLVPFLCFCKPQPKSQLAAEADSLILLTLEMQQRISSPEIQRLSEFQDEIIRDLMNLDDSVTYETAPAYGEGQSSDLVGQYSELNKNLEQCLKACSYFHEEAFLLEKTLAEIKDRAELKGADQAQLRELLNAERITYFELVFRIDSSLENVKHHAEIFYNLKPEIDSLLTHAENQPVK